MIRGNERKEIFSDDDDRDRFLDTLHKMKEDGNYHIYAYCLMNNHVHLLMKEGKDSIQRTMKRIGVSYVYYFNNKYLKAGMVKRVNDYKWSSYADYINKTGCREGLVENGFLLTLLSDSKESGKIELT